MKNVLMWGGVVLGAAVLLVGGFFAYNTYVVQNQSGEKIFEARGPVTAIDLEPMTYDGPGRISIESGGKNVIIEVPARMNLCAARENIDDISQIKIGEEVAVAGDVNEDGVVAPCASAEHYLKVTIAHYIDRSLGFGFEYPRGEEGYVVQVPPHGNEEAADFEDAVIVYHKPDYDAMQNAEGMEGPPTINVLVYKNTRKQTVRAWAEANSGVSNIGLKIGDVIETSLNGAKGIRYVADGLYRTETLVVASNEFIYLITGSYSDENAPIHKDFQGILNTFLFFTPR
ncbi:hypothetical protein K2X83_00625 [Patescibacteria group bacterium]|nr:hypothetical protein [Patescibacteria group bacterium]